MIYIVLLVDTFEEASELTNRMRAFTTPMFKIQAFARGQAMVGLRHGASRPTHVIDYIKDRDGEKFEEWFRACVLPTAARGEYIRSDRY